MGKGDKKRREMTPFSLKHFDHDDCKRCCGSCYVVEEDPKQPGVYDIRPCPEGCLPEKPENVMRELRMSASIQPLGGIFKLTACLGDEEQTISFKK